MPKEGLWPRVLILDQFEELVTTYPTFWHHREAFFRELDEAMHADPMLRVVMSLRSDCVQDFDRYAGLLENGLHARYHMLPLGNKDAQAAIEEPARLFGRPFADGAADKLARNLSQVREQDLEGQMRTVPGEWVEPIQLQVVCYQLWEKLAHTPGDNITLDHLKQLARSVLAAQIAADSTLQEDEDRLLSGLVDGALAAFYEDALAEVLEDPAAQAAGIDERRLRAWFDKELITADGMRSTVSRNEHTGRTGSLANAAVDSLARRYLVRNELHAGGTWTELVHDRFVEPIRASNAAWFPQHLSALQRQAALWDEQGRSLGLLLREEALAEAKKWAADHAEELQPNEREFLAACHQAQAAIERDRRQNRVIRILAVAAGLVAILAIAASISAWRSSAEAFDQKRIADDNAQEAVAAQATAEESAAEAKRQKQIADDNAQKAVAAQATAEASASEAKRQKQIADDNAQKAVAAQATAEESASETKRQKQVADDNAQKAVTAQATAEANAALVKAQLDRQAGLARLQEAYKLKEQGNALGAIEAFRAAMATNTDLSFDVETEIEDVRRKVATQSARQGEALAKAGDFAAAEAKFKAALALEPPPDTPVYVYVPAGPFVMGAGDEDERIASQFRWPISNEKPQGSVPLDAFWIQRTEVTNAQYLRCVEAREADGCRPPANGNIRYRDPQFAKQPVTGVTWFQARDYAVWVGGRLPTEAEWEKACRGTDDGRTYPWGSQDPTGELLNFGGTGLGTWSAVGRYPKGASPYGALDMAGNVSEWTSSAYEGYPYNPGDGREGPSASLRVVRGGSFSPAHLVRCAYRLPNVPDSGNHEVGFRVVVSPGF